jgi:hypothetical protein
MDKGLCDIGSSLCDSYWLECLENRVFPVHLIPLIHIRLANARGEVPDLDNPSLYVDEWLKGDGPTKELLQAKRYLGYLKQNRVHPRCLKPIYRTNAQLLIASMDSWWHARLTMLMLVIKFASVSADHYKESAKTDDLDYQAYLEAASALWTFIDSIQSAHQCAYNSGVTKKAFGQSWIDWVIEHPDEYGHFIAKIKSTKRGSVWWHRINLLKDILWLHTLHRSESVPVVLKRRRISGKNDRMGLEIRRIT